MTVEVLERLLNIKVSTEEIVPGKPEERVAKLQELSKEDLIRMILKPQVGSLPTSKAWSLLT